MKLHGDALSTWIPKLNKKVVHSRAQFWPRQVCHTNLTATGPLILRRQVPSPFWNSDEDESPGRREEVCTLDVDDGNTIWLEPRLTSRTHGTQELQRLQWWSRRNEIESSVILHLATNEPAPIAWPACVTLVRGRPFYGDDLALHLLGNVSRCVLVHAHLLHDSISSFLACTANTRFNGFHIFTSSHNSMHSYINLQRSIAASSS